MIRVDKKNTLPNGAIAAYTDYTPHIGDTVPVIYGDKEGTAIVSKTTLIIGGQLNLVILDVDWTSFEGISDGT